MKKRYKVVLNIEMEDPEKPFPAGGAFNHLNRINGTIKWVISEMWMGSDVTITLNKIIEKGEISER